MTLKDIVAQLKDKEAEAAIIPEEAPQATRAGVEAIVRNARQDIEALSGRYLEEVMKHVVVIAVTGANSAEFANFAKYKYRTMALDGQLATKRFLDSVVNRTNVGVYNQNAHFMVLDELNRFKLEYGIMSLPPLQLPVYTDGILDSPVGEAVPRILNKSYGRALDAVAVRREIGKAALIDRFAGKHLPVVVYNYVDFAGDFMPAPVLTVDASGPINEKFVKKQLDQVRAQIVGNKKADSTEDEAVEPEETIEE